VKVWGPRIALLLAGLFLVLAGVMFFVVGIGNLFSLVPSIFMSIVYVGIQKTFKDLADEVLICTAIGFLDTWLTAFKRRPGWVHTSPVGPARGFDSRGAQRASAHCSVHASAARPH